MSFFLEKSIPDILKLLESKKISPIDLLENSKKIYNKKEYKINAFTEINFNKAKKQIKDAIRKKKNGKIFGIPFAAKDIFNTENFKTQMGSQIWKNFTPGNNARVIDAILNEGGVIIGKTVTAEFAVHHLNVTKNPHNIKKTPGTSSSGSAAAVAIGAVPFALGSQTAGSIIRPASFCGIWGMKPTFGLIPRTGILKTSDTLDTVGFLTSHVANLKIILDIMRVRGRNYPLVKKNVDNIKVKEFNKKNLKIGFLITDRCNYAKNYIINDILYFKNTLKNNMFKYEDIKWPKELFDIGNIHEIIYNKSLSYYFKKEYELRKKKISRIMQEMIIFGNKISNNMYLEAISKQEKIIEKVSKILKDYDVVFTLSTSSSAVDRGVKEYPDPSLIWTLSHVPSINVPFKKCPENLPYGIQAISYKWNDYNLISALEFLANSKMIKKNSFFAKY